MIRRTACVFALYALLPAALGAQVILPLLRLDGRPVARVNHALEDQRDGTVWFATGIGLFYTSDGNILFEWTSQDGSRHDLRQISRVDDELWVGGEGGVYRIGRGYSYEKIDAGLPKSITVFTILAERIGDKENVWLGTDLGVFKRRPDDKFDLKLPGKITFLGLEDRGNQYTQENTEPQEFNLWASNESGLYTYNRGTMAFEMVPGSTTKNVRKVFRDKSGQIYLSTDSPLSTNGRGRGKTGPYLYHFPSETKVGVSSTTPLDVDVVDGTLWYSIDQIVRYAGPTGDKRRELCDEEIRAVKTVEESQRFIWLIHRYGILRYSKGEPYRCRTLATSTDENSWNLSSILETDRKGIFLYGTDGVYRVWEDIKINLTIAKRSFAFVNRYSVDDYGYYDTKDCPSESGGCAKWRPPGRRPESFSATFAASDQWLDLKLNDFDDHYRNVAKWSRWGYRDTYYIFLRDYYGNARRIAHPKVVLVSVYYTLIMTFYSLIAYTLISALMVFLIHRKLPLRLRNFWYSLWASLLAPNPMRLALLLTTKAMRRRLRDIYVDSWLARSDRPATEHASQMPDINALMSAIENSNEKSLDPEPEEALHCKYRAIAAMVCRKTGKESLRDSIPIIYRLGDDLDTVEKIEKEMLSRVKSDLDRYLWFSLVGDSFRSKLLDEGEFVFLFLYSGAKAVKTAASDFARKGDSRRRLAIGAVQDQEEAQGTAPQENGRKSGKVAEPGPADADTAAESSVSEPGTEPPPATPPESA